MWFRKKKCEACLSLAKALELEQKRVSDLTDKLIAISSPVAFHALQQSSNQGGGEVQGPLTKTVYDAVTGERIVVPFDDYLAAKKAAINGDQSLFNQSR